MKRPLLSPVIVRRGLVISIFALALPVFFTGFIAVPGKNSALSYKKNGVIDIEALIQKILILNQQNKHQEAMNLLMVAIEKNQEDPLLRTLLVQTFDMFLEDEIRFGELDIERNRKNSGAYLRVANALELKGEDFRAMETLINGISLSPLASQLWMSIAKLEHKAKRDKEALDVFKEVIRLDPKASDAYNNAAFILTQNSSSNAKDLSLAESYAKTARKLDPKNPEYIDTLAEIHFKKGDIIQAQKLIKEAIKLDPKHDFYRNQLKRFTLKNSVVPE